MDTATATEESRMSAVAGEVGVVGDRMRDGGRRWNGTWSGGDSG